MQSRQLWFKKGAFSGGSIRYPVGRTSYDNGDGITSIDNQDLARQIAEDVMAGAVMSLPSTMDKNGQFLWTYEPPKAGNEVRNILEYPQELDKEILIGMGIPPELVSAATVGSGYSGRAIPAQMFFSSCDEVVHLLVDAIDRQILRNLVVINFGRQCYHIVPDSLAEKVLDDNDKSKAKPKNDDKQPVQLSLTARKRLARKLRKLEHRLKLAWSSADKDKHPREKTGRFAKKGSGHVSAPPGGGGATPGGAGANSSGEWKRHVSKRGRIGWRHTESGHVSYQAERPDASDVEKNSHTATVAGKINQLLNKQNWYNDHEHQAILNSLPHLPASELRRHAAALGVTPLKRSRSAHLEAIQAGLEQRLSADRSAQALRADTTSRDHARRLAEIHKANEEAQEKIKDLWAQDQLLDAALKKHLVGQATPPAAGARHLAAHAAITREMSQKLTDIRQEKQRLVLSLRVNADHQRAELTNMLQPKNRIKIRVPANHFPPSGGTTANHTAAARFLTGITEGGHQVQAALKQSKLSGRPTAQSPKLHPNNPHFSVMAWPNTSTAQMVHEMGHLLEWQIPGAEQLAHDFLTHRTAGEKEVPLAPLFPGEKLTATEVGKKDHFDRLFAGQSRGLLRAYYCGKDYVDIHGQRIATEILSMGLEALYNDPAGFAAKDPEYCQFVIGVIQGTLK